MAGDAQNSLSALANLTALCDARLPGRHQIEVVDVFGHPERALADGIVMTPTVIRIEPGPRRRVVGTLKATDDVAAALGLGQALGLAPSLNGSEHGARSVGRQGP
ncbi:MAG: circadian clock KaiB family protein [Candidatus Limnocylindrales bacterium]